VTLKLDTPGLAGQVDRRSRKEYIKWCKKSKPRPVTLV
jgi:hypothetical protein